MKLPDVRAFFPIVSWLPRYRWSDARGDLLAGLTVGIMLIPQGMAYAILAGMPPIYGLYASIVPLLAYAVFGTSRHLSVGTMAIDSLIMIVGLSALAEVGSEDYIGLAFALALMVGAIHLLLGAMRFGFIVNLLSRPVIVGFTSAAAVIIGFSQLSNLLGIPLPRTEFVYVLVWESLKQLGAVHLPSLTIGAGGIAVLVLLRRWKPVFPGALTVVVLATATVWWFGLDRAGVKIVGDIPTGLPAPVLPVAAWNDLLALFPTAVTLALIQFTNVVSLGKVFASRHRYSIRPNQELIALGAINVLGAFFRSFPVSGSFSRSAVNEQAGGRTPMTNAIAAALIILTVLVLTPLFRYLPVPILASIIMVAAFGMVDLDDLRDIYATKRVDGRIAALTFVVTLVAGLQIGIAIGIAMSVIAIMYRISRPHVAELGHLPGTRSFRDVETHPEALAVEGIFLMRIDASFGYANADYLKELLLARADPKRTGIRAIVIDASTVNDIDTTAATMLLEIGETLAERGVDLYFTGIHGGVGGVLERSGLREALGDDHFFLSPHRAVSHILQDWSRADDYFARVPAGSVPSDLDD